MRKCRSKRQYKLRSGSALFSLLVSVIMLIMLATAMVDLGYLYACKSRMQNGADAAALAAAMRIGNENTVESRAEAQSWAIGFANYNLPSYGAVLVAGDVTFGTWDPGNETFTVGGSTPNAVQAVVRRDGTNTDSVAMFFANIFGASELGLTTTATAMIGSSSAAEGMPMALRAPGFGAIDADFTAANPGKDGPSSPTNGQFFEVGEQVIVCTYKKGSQSPVHLALDIDDIKDSDLKKILKGDSDPIEMQVGDEVSVLHEGTDKDEYGKALEERLKKPTGDPERDIIMAIVETLPGSRDDNGKLKGDVRIADFVAVHLDEIVELEIVDPKDSKKKIKVKYLMGTISNHRAETSWGGATPSGAGGASVGVIELVN